MENFTCAYIIYSKSSMNCGLFRPLNFLRNEISCYPRIFGWRWRIFLTCAYVYSKSSMNYGLFCPSNLLRNEISCYPRIFGWRWRIFLTCAYVYSKSSMNCGLFRPSNFLLFESSNIRIEKENLPYLCVCNMHIFEIFDELWTLSSNFLRNEISCYLNRQIFGWRWRILLVRMYIRNLR